eukprot:6180873-Pleurochrysis_carterae.AAC.2
MLHSSLLHDAVVIPRALLKYTPWHNACVYAIVGPHKPRWEARAFVPMWVYEPQPQPSSICPAPVVDFGDCA